MTTYNLTDYTEVTQYTVEGTEDLEWGKKYHPVFHGREFRPWDDAHPNPVQLEEGFVEIGGPTLTPQDDEIFDEEILAYSNLQNPIYPDAITLSDVTKTIKVWDTYKLTVSFTPAWASFPVTWSSSDSTKASIASDWTITWVAEWENIKITATSWYAQAECIVKVEKVAVTGVSISKSETTITAWETETITASVLPDNATYKWITRSTSDWDVATVDWWVITAVAAGTATITATSDDDSSKKATCTVTVEAVTPTETPTETETETPTETPVEP